MRKHFNLITVDGNATYKKKWKSTVADVYKSQGIYSDMGDYQS